MGKAQSEDLGSVTCSIRGAVVAGSWQTCVLTYTAGFAGIDDTGSLKIVMRYATDCGIPQFDDPGAPNYATAVASNGARLQLRYDVKDNVRPWGRTIHIKVLQGYLRKGDTLRVVLGDTSHGSPGWRMQTFAEPTFELRVLVDRYATYVYEPLAKSPEFRIKAGLPERLVAVAPSAVATNQPIDIRYRVEDAWGNPVGRPKAIRNRRIRELGVHRIAVSDRKSGLMSETNPIVVTTEQHAEVLGRHSWAK